MFVYEEKTNLFNKKLDSISDFLNKVIKSEYAAKEIEKEYFRFIEQDCEYLLELIHNILLDLKICSKIQFTYGVIIIILNQNGNVELDEIKYIFNDLYIYFKYIHEHLLLEASLNISG